MIDACLSLSEAHTDIAVAFDDDDSDAYPSLASSYGSKHVWWFTGRRDTLAGWTNWVAFGPGTGGKYRAFASLGDDHVPRTQGWDRLLLDEIDRMGGTGIAYGDDLHQRDRLPTAPVISADIVAALGWMCEPTLAHMHVDDAWRDLGRGAGCLAYVPGVVIEHCHPDAGKAAADETYAASVAGWAADREAYARWRRERMAADVAKVAALRAVA
jgi:hypothetical protein